MKKTTNRRWLFAITLGAASIMNAQAAIQLAVNGGFETGDTTGWTYFPTATSTFGVVTPGASSTYAGGVDNTFLASSAVIKQNAVGAGVVAVGQTLTISFDFLELSGVGGVVFAELFTLDSGGGVTSSQILGGAPLFGTSSFTPRSFTPTLTANVDGGVTLQFAVSTGAATGSFVNAQFDNVSMTVIPEPASAALLGLGGLALIARRRRHA
jgi:hypothetical protein